jgi:hypothetical protein
LRRGIFLGTPTGKEQSPVQLAQHQPRASLSVCITWGVRLHTSADMQFFLMQLCDVLSQRLTATRRASHHVSVTIWKSQDVSVEPAFAAFLLFFFESLISRAIGVGF